MNDEPLHVVLANAPGLRALLAESREIRVIAEGEDSAQIFDCVGQYRPEVVILNDRLPGRGCLDVIRQLRASGSTVGILVLMTVDQASDIRAILNAGANGFVLKSAESPEIIEAIQAVYDASCLVAQLKRKEADAHR